MELRGRSLIGAGQGAVTGEVFRAVDPSTGEPLPGEFHACTLDEVDRAARLAESAVPGLGALDARAKGAFLRRIADEIESIVENVKVRAPQETGLPVGRINAETGRTTGQLRLFAELVEEGSWVDARIDHADPARQPAPKPDVRSMHRPLGPVAVFCASNFPLAFSVAGGDTAAALAAGCPVIVKAHHAHPGTAELVGRAVRRAVDACGLPEGTFSLLYGGGKTVGAALVQHPALRAVGFTGSRAGGRALFDLAAARPEPIPVYAEMSSINPVFLMPGALSERGEAIAAGLHASLNLGVGQFCTNPGLVFLVRGEATDRFESQFTALCSGTAPATMLHAGIRQSYQAGVAQKVGHDRVTSLAVVETGPGVCEAAPAVFRTDLATFLEEPVMSEEVFGPSTLLVVADSPAELVEAAGHLEGQLTASLHAAEAELAGCADLIAVLERKVGRLICNGLPTGVEVCHAMVHGGPYPSTSDGRSTSVGTSSIYRFTRLIGYQDWPDAALPAELREGNPLGIHRLVDGQRQ